ncbi:MAG: hypothetical protein R3E96_02150 [Planctomycetota bacterium]
MAHRTSLTLQNQYTILPGTSWKFQCWYRDWVNGCSTSNFRWLLR